jgi:hypothetical protein
MPARNHADGMRSHDRGVIAKDNPIALKVVRLLAEIAVRRILADEDRLYEKPQNTDSPSQNRPGVTILPPQTANHGRE